MSKFLPIGTKGELLNSDMIARIIPKEDGGCIILTKDGQHFHSEIDLHDEVNDYNSIRSIILARASALSIWMMMATAKSAPALL